MGVKKVIVVNPVEIVPEGSKLSPIPQPIEIKEGFEVQYKEMLGDRYGEFLQYSLSYIRKCIRVNTLKISVEDLKKRLENDWNLEPISWCPEGFYIEYKHGERYDLGNLPEHQLGYFYVQDAASMIPPVVLQPKPGETVLDLCAAPGSKTTQMAAMMKNKGLVVANDISGSRLKPLGLNLNRMGVVNTIVTLKGNRRFGQIFDKVLVDAPCSATGTIRRSLKTLKMWSPGAVQSICMEQRGVLKQAWEVLKPGGTMVYSTCTLEPEEDEGMVSWFLNKFDDCELLPINLNINHSKNISKFNNSEYSSEVSKTLRIYPQDNDTEGFFVAKFRKKN